MLVLVDYNLFYFLISIFLNFLYLKCIFNILELNLIFYLLFKKDSVQFSLVTQLCLTLCNSMDSSISDFPVHHQLLELAQSHVHWVCDAILPSHSLSSLLLQPSIFPRIRVFSNESVLCIRWPKYWSFSFSISPPMNIQGWFPLGLTGLIPLQSKELSRVFSNTMVQKHQFFSAQLSSQSNSHIHTWLLEKP